MFGRRSGFAAFAIWLSFQIDGPSLGKGVPPLWLCPSAFTVKRVMSPPDKFLPQLCRRKRKKPPGGGFRLETR
ncbi:hypothetical protein F4V89_02915 [Neorhizobium galegae]|nr:hypothetical protein F4V88_17625 [Neorhizobium galegae]KAB1115397.1 hypothetical protein F4V89_02915 [Neorhizobium galegae]